MLKKPQINGVTPEERQRQTEAFLDDLVEEINRKLDEKTLSAFLDTAIMSVKTAKAGGNVPELSKFKNLAAKLKELSALIEKI